MVVKMPEPNIAGGIAMGTKGRKNIKKPKKEKLKKQVEKKK